RAQNIHVLLDAIPGRQGAAHCDWDGDASKKSDLFKAAPVIGRWSLRAGCGKQRMDALRRRATGERIPAATATKKPREYPPGAFWHCLSDVSLRPAALRQPAGPSGPAPP